MDPIIQFNKQLSTNMIPFRKNSINSINNISFIKNIKQAKICIIYVYYERKNETKNQTNLSYFIKYGLDDTKWLKLDITTVFVINGHQCEVIIPKKENIHVLLEDNCSDYEGWLNGINYITKKNNKSLDKQFDYLCLINSSTFGPIMEPTIDSHWLCPFYESMLKYGAIACSPYINVFNIGNNKTYTALSCSFTLIKIDETVINLLTNTPVISSDENISNKYYNTVLGKKKDKNDAILTGENGLSRVLLTNGYTICCLYKDNHRPSYPLYEREEFLHNNNELLKQTVFIKNVWRSGGPLHYASKPILYKYCIDFMNKQLNYKNIFDGLDVDYNYDLLNINHNNKKEFYNTYGYAEEYILFPKKKYEMKGVVLYAHYDSNNIIADYVIQGLKSLVYIGYDIIFYTASSSINNIDVSILPFNVHFITNKGAGTDWEIWLNGLQTIKKENLNYEWIMFINDSLLFPINGITNFMNSVITIRKTCDFWGHWLSPEINLHLVGTPIEFKYNLIDDIIIFIKNNIPLCKDKNDFIYKIETKFTQYLFEKNYKMNSIIKYTDFNSDTRYVQCPMFNKKFLKNWVNEKKTFAIKWKYCISNLTNDDVSHEFNFLSKYLYYGKYGILSPISN